MQADPDQVKPVQQGVIGLTPLDEELSTIEPTARKRWPDTFAGLWHNEGPIPRQIHIAFTDDAEAKVAELAKGFSRPEMLQAVDAKYSLRHLEQLQQEIAADREAARGSDNPLDGLRGARYDLAMDVPKNVVLAIVPAELDVAQASITRAYGNPGDPGRDDVKVVEGGLAQPQQCLSAWNCGLDLRGGTGTWFPIVDRPGFANSCAMAFSVLGPGGAHQILSAAHCADGAAAHDVGNTRYHRIQDARNMRPENLFGSVQAQVKSGAVDAERISIGNGFRAHPWVYLNQDNQEVSITEVGTYDTLPIGHWLCHPTIDSQYSCGPLQDKTVMPSYIPGGNRFLGIALSPPSAPGDSGAPIVYASIQAQGIISGGLGGPRRDWTIAGHIQFANQALGTTLMPNPTQTFLTLGARRNGQPGWSSVSGTVHGGSVPIDGEYVNVNFQKLVNGVWQTMSTAQPTVVNGAYAVNQWGVGVGQWRVRAVLPPQGLLAQSESGYHYFEIRRS